METDLAIRAVMAMAILITALGAWKLTGMATLRRARNTGAGASESPEGFIHGRPGLLVFGSPACAACVHAQKPALIKLERQLSGAVQFLEVDVEERPELASRYGVLSLPTVFVLDSAGTPVRVNPGFVSADELGRQLSPYL